VRSSRPGPVELLVYGSLLVLGLLGLASPGIYNLLPAESVLEGVFLVATVLSMARIDVAARSFLLVALLYVAVKVALIALTTSGASLDFVQAYKAYFYLLGLAFFVRKGLFDGRRLARFSCVLIMLFFAKYAYSVVGGLDARPGIYTENNFELVLLMGLFYLGFPYAGRWRHPFFVLLTATVLISASRSAALGLVIVYVGLYLRLRNRFWPLHVVGLAGLGAAVVAVFLGRDPQGLQTIDRFNFLQVFLWETRNWPIWEFVTGSYPLTALSPGSCSRLAFYVNEFSLSNTGACYSVILHSYLLRAAFDQGLLGLALLYVLVWLGLARSGAGRRDILVLLGVLTASGLSVSSFNNVFAALTLAIACGLRRRATSADLPAARHRAPRDHLGDRGSQLLVGDGTGARSTAPPLVEARLRHPQHPGRPA
jgi:hypothetical protein